MKWVYMISWHQSKYNTLSLISNLFNLSKNISWMCQSYLLLISIEFYFHFGFLWCSSLVINFPFFFKQLFRPMKILLLRHSQNNDQIWLYWVGHKKPKQNSVLSLKKYLLALLSHTCKSLKLLLCPCDKFC